MKKALSLLLALVLCLSLCACGNSAGESVAEDESTAPETTAAPTEALTYESLAGTYESILWCLHDSITLNSNTTYDYKDEVEHTENTTYDSEERAEKGTYSISDNKVVLDEKLDYGMTSTLPHLVVNDCLYDSYWRVLKEDVDYGLAFSPDASGMTDQTFESWVVNADIPGSNYNYLSLDLNSDGTFVLVVGYMLSALKDSETFNGTYSYADSFLVLTYEGADYPLYVTENGQIYFVGYKKA